MNRVLKVLGCLVLAGVLLVAGVIATIEFQSRRSLGQVKEIVRQISPGTAFDDVVGRLGKPVQSYTNAEAIVIMGTRKESDFTRSTALHKFVHQGPPFRWILIYTDKESLKVVYADWNHM